MFSTVSFSFCNRFGYAIDELIGKPFSKVLPAFAAMVFNDAVFNGPVSVGKFVDEENEFFARVTYVTLVTKSKEYIRTKGVMSIVDDRITLKFQELVSGDVQHPQIPIRTLQSMANDQPCSPDAHRSIKLNDTVCVMIDLCNSTKLITSVDSMAPILKLYHSMYTLALQTVVQFEPFARIHETCGDSICIIFNSFGQTFLTPDKLCNTALVMTSRILQTLNAHLRIVSERHRVELYMRCGMSMGNVVGGVIDGRSFRIFGSCVNKAARLESISCKDYIFLDRLIYEKISNRNNVIASMQCATHHLRGFPNPEDVYCVHTNVFASLNEAR